MNGFNPIIINTAYVLGYNAMQNAAQKEGTGVNNQNVQNQTPIQNVNGGVQTTSNMQPVNSNFPILPQTAEALNKAVLSTIQLEKQADYIKELLNLPKNFQDLIGQIQSNNPNMQAIKDLSKLLSGGKINLTALTALLSENSKEAVQKLMMTIISVSKTGADINQLKELMGMISQNGATDNIQAMKNLLMLYLPYLPMSVRMELNLDFNIDIFDKIEGPDPDKQDKGETIKILIQTANFGNVLATLDLAPNNDIDVFIQAIDNFPEQEVLKLFKEENKKTGVNSNISIEKNKNEKSLEDFKQNIQIVSSDYVSPKLVLACHSLIKVIIDVDSKEFIINEEE